MKPTPQTFEELISYFLSIKANIKSLKVRTLDKYQYYFRLVFEHIPTETALKDLKTENFDTLYLKLLNDYHPNTVNQIHHLCNSVFEMGEKKRLITYNPVRYASPPHTLKPQITYRSRHDLRRLLDVMQSEPLKWRVMIDLMITTTRRRGEVLALRFSDIDFKNRTVCWHQNLQYTRQNGIFLTSRKSGEISYDFLDENSINLILALYASHNQYRINHDLPDWNAENFLFVNRSGGHMHPNSATTYLARLSKRTGIGHFNPHMLRHSVASAMYEAGATDLQVAKQLNHRQPTTTRSHYIHYNFRQPMETRVLINRLFR